MTQKRGSNASQGGGKGQEQTGGLQYLKNSQVLYAPKVGQGLKKKGFAPGGVQGGFMQEQEGT